MFKRSLFVLVCISLLVFSAVTFAQEPTQEPTAPVEPTDEPIVTVEPTEEPIVTVEPTEEPMVPTLDVTEQPTESGGTGDVQTPPESTIEPTDSPAVESGTGVGAMSMGMMMGMMMRQAGANAVLMDVDGNQVGEVWFFEFDEDDFNTMNDDAMDGKTFVVVQVNDMPEGFHGFHVHTTGSCDTVDGQPFMAAGGHLNPDGASHGDHAGDLPSLLVGADGTGYAVYATDRFTIEDLFDEDGGAVIVHADADNYTNIPERYGGPDEETLKAGDAGDRMACAVIEEGAGEGMGMSGGMSDSNRSSGASSATQEPSVDVTQETNMGAPVEPTTAMTEPTSAPTLDTTMTMTMEPPIEPTEVITLEPTLEATPSGG